MTKKGESAETTLQITAINSGVSVAKKADDLEKKQERNIATSSR